MARKEGEPTLQAVAAFQVVNGGVTNWVDLPRSVRFSAIIGYTCFGKRGRNHEQRSSSVWDLGSRRPYRGPLLGDAGPLSGGDGQRRVAAFRGAGLLRHSLQVLRPVHTEQGA